MNAYTFATSKKHEPDAPIIKPFPGLDAFNVIEVLNLEVFTVKLLFSSPPITRPTVPALTDQAFWCV